MNLWRNYRAYLLTIALLVAAMWPLRHAGETTYDDRSPLVAELPARVGTWQGKHLRFCVNGRCDTMQMMDQVNATNRCDRCGEALDVMRHYERGLLPADTAMIRKGYVDGLGQTLFVTAVVSGRDRASIHRPEFCLSTEENQITSSRVETITRPGDAPLELRLLTLRNTAGGSTSYAYFAYWFIAEGHETASHIERMLWMAYDRIVHGQTRRWAYISITGPITPGSIAHLDTLRTFVRDLQPQLVAR